MTLLPSLIIQALVFLLNITNGGFHFRIEIFFIFNSLLIALFYFVFNKLYNVFFKFVDGFESGSRQYICSQFFESLFIFLITVFQC